jgi:hypothetical protein
MLRAHIIHIMKAVRSRIGRGIAPRAAQQPAQQLAARGYHGRLGRGRDLEDRRLLVSVRGVGNPPADAAMPRAPRLDGREVLHHVMAPGPERACCRSAPAVPGSATSVWPRCRSTAAIRRRHGVRRH